LHNNDDMTGHYMVGEQHTQHQALILQSQSQHCGRLV
jgi:hypothetical protein